MDMIRNKSDEAAVDAGCYFDIKAADRVRYFFAKFLKHSKGQFAGERFELLDWEWEYIVAPAYGLKRPDGLRRFKWVGAGVPKKNGKSTLLSGISLYMLIGDNEPGAEVYSIASDREQASIVYNESTNMVEKSTALSARLRIRKATKRIMYPAGQAIYRVLSSISNTKEGYNTHCLLFDELHAQKNRDLWNVFRYSGASRRQPLFFWISTAGVDKDNIGYEQWEYARKIQNSQIIDTDYLPYIQEPDEKDDWKQEATWKKVNPSYAITINARDFQTECTQAQENPAEENIFKRYRLNIWTAQTTRWISIDKWEACARQYSQADLKGEKCWLGLDLATTTDICAAVALFKVDTKFRVLPYFWIPREALTKRARSNKTRLEKWVAEGRIKVTDGDVQDYGVIRADINALADVTPVREVDVDPWNATSLATDLQGDGFKVEYVRTGFLSISAATKEFEKLVLSQGIEHPNCPVLNWMFGNLAIEHDASGNIKPNKKKSTEKIDGMVALISALARAIKTLTKKSQYEEGASI